MVHDPFGERRLIGYMALEPSESAAPAELRRFLAEQLPQSMVVPEFVYVESLRRTAEGQPDWNTLPEPDTTGTQRDTEYVPPRDDLERELVAIWEENLDVRPIGIRDNFFDLGGHSLLFAYVIGRVYELSQGDLPLATVFLNEPTIEQLADVVRRPERGRLGAANATAAIVRELKADAVLDPALQFGTADVKRAVDPTSILLTGGNGFIGSFLLEELLRQTRAIIYGIVRAEDAEHAAAKLRKALESYMLWDPAFASRIVTLVGDLSEPRLGLTASSYQTLASTVDVIYHAGAEVNFVYPYSRLKRANVRGTLEILRLAGAIKPKPVHFISTLGVFSVDGADGIRRFREEEPLECDRLSSGYAQSKWVAEKLVEEAGLRGLPVCRYRAGVVAGHSITGAGQVSDMWGQTLKACIEASSVPDFEAALEMAPVDVVVKAIVHLARQQTSFGGVFHLHNPAALKAEDAIEAVRTFGYPMKRIPYEEWRERLKQLKDTSLSQLLELSEQLDPGVVSRLARSAAAWSEPPYDRDNTARGLSGASFAYPIPDEKLIHTYLTYFVQSGILAPPSRTP